MSGLLTERKCRSCGQVKPLEQFDVKRKGLAGRNSQCKECRKAYHRDYYRQMIRPVTVSEKHCIWCGHTFPASAFSKDRMGRDGLRGMCKECALDRGRLQRAELRATVLKAYGNKCACCGENHAEFLAIDHVNGDGHKEREALGQNHHMILLRKIREEGFPPTYRVLCHNCNQAIGIYGYCPHELDRSVVEEGEVQDE